MNLTVNTKALYTKVSDNLREDIKNGKYKNGDKLPSENMLATRYSISRLTARQALSVLVNEGLVEKFQGKGYFCKRDVTGKKIHVLLDMTDYYFIPYYIQSISRILEENGADLIAEDTKNSYKEILKLIEKILKNDSDGIIIQSSPEEDFNKTEIEKAFSRLKQKGIPFIQIDTHFGIKNSSFAIMDEKNMGRTAAKHYKSMGHTNVAAIYVENNRISKERMNSFVEEFNHAFIIYDNEDLKENLLDACKKGVTGIFCYSDFVAKKCIDILTAADFNIPDDISIITADDTLVSKLYNLTAVTHAKEALGEFAAKTIIGEKTPVHKVFATNLTERNSVKNLKI